MNSLLDVLTGTYITTTRRRALQDVNLKHSDLLAGVIISRAGGIRTHDLLNPIQAHYQAVLRPVAFGLSTELIELAKQLFEREAADRETVNARKIIYEISTARNIGTANQ